MKILPLLMLSITASAGQFELNELEHDQISGFAKLVPFVKQLAQQCYDDEERKSISEVCSNYHAAFVELRVARLDAYKVDKQRMWTAIANNNDWYKAYLDYDYILILNRKNSQKMAGYYK